MVLFSAFPGAGSAADRNVERGKTLAPACEAFSVPGAALSAVYGPVIGTADDLPYLDRPLLPLALALPRMLQEIEAEFATAGPAETRRLRQRAGLIRELLPPAARRQSPPRHNLEQSLRLGSLLLRVAAPARVGPGAISPRRGRCFGTFD